MSLHEQIVTAMQKYLDDHDACATISVKALAKAALDKVATEKLPPEVEYLALIGAKDIGRPLLAGQFGKRADKSVSVIRTDQGELFSGKLQSRYPVRQPGDDEPTYKRRDLLTRAEVRKIVGSYRRTGESWIAHGDALEAWDAERIAPEERDQSA